MALFTWKPEYSVGVKEFDDQHKKLVEILNALFEAMKNRKSSEILDGILHKLVDYTVFHFSSEEKLMQKYNYLNYQEHSRQHKDLTNQVLKFQAEYKTGKITISAELLNFLKDWLTKHIIGDDKKYGAFFNGKGIS